jgi:hypothetical protein
VSFGFLQNSQKPEGFGSESISKYSIKKSGSIKIKRPIESISHCSCYKNNFFSKTTAQISFQV